MLTAPDFEKKQIIFVMFNEGEKLSLSNSNIVIKRSDGSVKFQCTCYRIFLIFAVGHCSLTSPVLQAAKKFGFFIALMTPGFRLYSLIGAEKEGNTLLHRKQYQYDDISLAKWIIRNKIMSQTAELKAVRNKSEALIDAISLLDKYYVQSENSEEISELMAYEGLASKVYFRNHFNNVLWNGRQPRLKRDHINSSLDIGYSLLFSFIDTLLSSYGFDTYCGIMHSEFYMRKSLVCDIIEPFRPIIDHTIKKAVNLKQIQEEHFLDLNGQKKLKWEHSAEYASLFLKAILEYKSDIFNYIQGYYRSFMKGVPADKFPVFIYKV